MRIPPIPTLALTLLLLPAAGCEQGPPPLVPVRGKVFYRGAPLHTGTIVFAPDTVRGGCGPQASAEIGPDGSYVLRVGTATGAAPGWYRVTVLAVEPAGPASRPHRLVPGRFSDPELSGLACEVKPGQENAINFNLE